MRIPISLICFFWCFDYKNTKPSTIIKNSVDNNFLEIQPIIVQPLASKLKSGSKVYSKLDNRCTLTLREPLRPPIRIKTFIFFYKNMLETLNNKGPELSFNLGKDVNNGSHIRSSCHSFLHPNPILPRTRRDPGVSTLSVLLKDIQNYPHIPVKHYIVMEHVQEIRTSFLIKNSSLKDLCLLPITEQVQSVRPDDLFLYQLFSFQGDPIKFLTREDSLFFMHEAVFPFHLGLKSKILDERMSGLDLFYNMFN